MDRKCTGNLSRNKGKKKQWKKQKMMKEHKRQLKIKNRTIRTQSDKRKGWYNTQDRKMTTKKEKEKRTIRTQTTDKWKRKN